MSNKTRFKSKTSQFDINLTTEKFCFGNKNLDLLRISNLDDLVDQISDDVFNVDERLPYWAELWPSAIGFSRFILNNSNIIQNSSVIELGCGLGLTSMAIMLQKPNQFLCTDYEHDALDLARRNFEINHIDLPNFQFLDWREPKLDHSFERIVASDVLYEKRFFQPILELFNRYLTSNGKIILAEPNRNIAIPFFTRLKEFGYHYTVFFEEVKQDKQTILVSIYLIEKKK